MNTKEISVRRAKMIALRKSGKTLQAIGDIFSVSRERVRQIVTNPPSAPKLETIRTCSICGSLFSHLQHSATYCKKCLASGLTSMRGRERTREVVRIRDGHKCQTCGVCWIRGQRRLDVHHIDGECGKKSKKYDKIKEIGGMITLCHRCHFSHHQFNRKNMGGKVRRFDRKTAKALIDGGTSQTEVAKLLGVSQAAMSQAMSSGVVQ